jgi:hypothetical protein
LRKRRSKTSSGEVHEDEHKRIAVEVSKRKLDDVKTGEEKLLQDQGGGTYVLAITASGIEAT